MGIRGEELRDRGFGGIWGVGQGALHPPALVVLSHTPPTSKQAIAWVGKGIVYDTGGLSIKGKTAMPGMKRDCGGAAGILGAFKVAVARAYSHYSRKTQGEGFNATPRPVRDTEVRVEFLIVGEGNDAKPANLTKEDIKCL